MAFSRDFTTNLTPQCRALKTEKLNALLFPGPREAVDLQMNGGVLGDKPKL